MRFALKCLPAGAAARVVRGRAAPAAAPSARRSSPALVAGRARAAGDPPAARRPCDPTRALLEWMLGGQRRLAADACKPWAPVATLGVSWRPQPEHSSRQRPRARSTQYAPRRPRHRGGRVQAQVLGLGARLRLVGGEAARRCSGCSTSSSGSFMRLGDIPHYPRLPADRDRALVTYFSDATSLSMYSLVARGSLAARKLAFPRLIVPISATTTAAITLGVNFVAVAVFIAVAQVVPAAELAADRAVPARSTSSSDARRRDDPRAALRAPARHRRRSGSSSLQLMFYASPIIYPVGFLPPWWKPIAFLSPFVQIMQDIRAIVLPGAPVDTPTTVYGDARGASSSRCRDRRRSSSSAATCYFRRESTVRRGAGLTMAPPRSRSSDVRKSVPASRTSSGTRSRSTSCTRCTRTTYEANQRAPGRLVLGRGGRVLRHHRPERQRQEHAAQDHRRHLPARRGHRARARHALAVHRARRRLQPGADGARQHPHQRDAARPHEEAARRAVRRDHRVRRARAVRRPEAEELLVGHAGAARVLDRDPGRLRRSCCSTRCSPSATQSFQEKCFATFERFRAEGKTIVFVSHDLGSVRSFCDRALLIRNGCAEAIGPPGRGHRHVPQPRTRAGSRGRARPRRRARAVSGPGTSALRRTLRQARSASSAAPPSSASRSTARTSCSSVASRASWRTRRRT